MTERKTDTATGATRPTLELVEAARLCRFRAADGWPEALALPDVAALQAYAPGRDQKAERQAAAPWHKLLELAADAGELNISETTTREQVAPARVRTPDRFTRAADWPARYSVGGVPRAYTEQAKYRDVARRTITAPALAAWLRAQGEAPSELVRAWFAAYGVSAAGTGERPTLTVEKLAALGAFTGNADPDARRRMNEAVRKLLLPKFGKATLPVPPAVAMLEAMTEPEPAARAHARGAPSRQAQGTARKLNDAQRQDLVRRFKEGEKVASLARRFNVSRRTVDDVLARAGVKKVTPRDKPKGGAGGRTYRAGTRTR